MRYLLSLLLVAMFAMPAYAGFAGGDAGRQGGFSGPMAGVAAQSVAEAKKLPDDRGVVLVGNIVSKIAGEKDEYIFRDSTGDIRVEIKDRVFAGQDVTPSDKVRISGKIDKDFMRDPEVEVHNLQVVK